MAYVKGNRTGGRTGPQSLGPHFLEPDTFIHDELPLASNAAMMHAAHERMDAVLGPFACEKDDGWLLENGAVTPTRCPSVANNASCARSNATCRVGKKGSAPRKTVLLDPLTILIKAGYTQRNVYRNASRGSTESFAIEHRACFFVRFQTTQATHSCPKTLCDMQTRQQSYRNRAHCELPIPQDQAKL